VASRHPSAPPRRPLPLRPPATRANANTRHGGQARPAVRGIALESRTTIGHTDVRTMTKPGDPALLGGRRSGARAVDVGSDISVSREAEQELRHDSSERDTGDAAEPSRPSTRPARMVFEILTVLCVYGVTQLGAFNVPEPSPDGTSQSGSFKNTDSSASKGGSEQTRRSYPAGAGPEHLADRDPGAHPAPRSAEPVAQGEPPAVDTRGVPLGQMLVEASRPKQADQTASGTAPELPPAAESSKFDRAAASAALSAATSAAGRCETGGSTRSVRVAVVFEPSGKVASTRIESGPTIGTRTSGCIARAFRRATVPPFKGGRMTMMQDVNIR
jgi:hypothetical protein